MRASRIDICNAFLVRQGFGTSGVLLIGWA
jgi:hypothetical protein